MTRPCQVLSEQAVQFFDILARTDVKDKSYEKKGLRAEMFPVITGLAQSLKELIHIGLVQALRLSMKLYKEQEEGLPTAIFRFLDKFKELEKNSGWATGRYRFKEQKSSQSVDHNEENGNSCDEGSKSRALQRTEALRKALERLSIVFDDLGKRPDEVKQSKMHDMETKINTNVIDKKQPPSILRMMETDNPLPAGPTFGKVQLGNVKHTTSMIIRPDHLVTPPSAPPIPPATITTNSLPRKPLQSSTEATAAAPLSRAATTTAGSSKMNTLRRALSGRRRKASSFPKVIDSAPLPFDNNVAKFRNPTTQSLPTLTSQQILPPRLMDLSETEEGIVRHLAVLHLGACLKDLSLEELANLADPKKAVTLWSKLRFQIRGGAFRQQQSLQALEQEDYGYDSKTFGVSLAAVVRRESMQNDHPSGPKKKVFPPIFLEKMSPAMKACFMEGAQIPSFVQHCILAIWQVDMLTEGIFRKNGNIRDLKKICQMIDEDPTHSDVMYLGKLNSIQLAALLKRFFREMPEPLLTFRLHKLFVAAMDFSTEEESKSALHFVCCLLPKPNRDVMQLLFSFLHKVSLFQDSNSMDIHNLARVFAPNVLYPEKETEQQRKMVDEINAVSLLIQYQEEFSIVPTSFNKLLEDTNILEGMSQMDPKQFIKTYSSLFKKQSSTKAQNRRSSILNTQQQQEQKQA
ncbi:hypothetical protein EC973_005591 [Apophysomyces ossiformis]|uniref:Rho-GAP domain-containing protein n=1 Tax=Apophysomyces ossiformis TaxID=679940 RepID=A0A8H7EQX8_9FUNG|nr:hypothetical protein EC973_005591 [Apophysomyces ossiformis]